MIAAPRPVVLLPESINGHKRRFILLLRRQRQLLGLLNALGGRMGNRDFQKLLFLYCVDIEETPSYHFVPYRYGGFSFTSYADRRKLVAAGFLEDDDQVWRLTQSGQVAARRPTAALPRMASFCRRTRLRGDALVAETYRRYPYYATRSEIVDGLGLRCAEIGRIKTARPSPQKPGLMTIGYEGRCLEEYLNTLLRAGVTVLCDVRRNAISRKYGFSKTVLSRASEGVGLDYRHLPELGIASERRRELATAEDYAALFEAYEQDTLADYGPVLQQCRDWVRDGDRVALTCYERSPERCHRHCVAKAVSRLGSELLPVEHL